VKITKVDEYHKHGCYFIGKLVVVDYQDDLKSDPDYGRFGSDTSSDLYIDYAVKALNLVKERYPGCHVLICLPDVVARIGE
jgi:hypothetical protein